jgi:hypothetical protein
MRIARSPELKTHRLRCSKDTISTNTARAASRLCQPIVSATQEPSSKIHPISSAWSLDQTAKTPQRYGMSGCCGTTPCGPNSAYRSGSRDIVQPIVTAPNAILTKPRV